MEPFFFQKYFLFFLRYVGFDLKRAQISEHCFMSALQGRAASDTPYNIYPIISSFFVGIEIASLKRAVPAGWFLLGH